MQNCVKFLPTFADGVSLNSKQPEGWTITQQRTLIEIQFYIKFGIYLQQLQIVSPNYRGQEGSRRQPTSGETKSNSNNTGQADFKTCNAICIILPSLWKRIFVMNEKGYYHWNYANTLCDAGRKVVVVEIRNVLRDDASCKKIFISPLGWKGSTWRWKIAQAVLGTALYLARRSINYGTLTKTFNPSP